MKSSVKIMLLAVIILTAGAFTGIKKVMNANSSKKPSPEERHISINDFPKDMVINHLDDWGGMVVGLNDMPAGTDLGPMFEGLKNNSCQVPHWGIILKGSARLTYDNGKQVSLKEGDIFYMPPGHTAVVDEDLKILDFSPEKEFKSLLSHIEEKMAEMNQQHE